MTYVGAVRRDAGNSQRSSHTIIAAGVRVDVISPRARTVLRGSLFKLHNRNPFRRPPPEIEDELPQPLEPEAHREPIIIDPVPAGAQHRSSWTLAQIIRYLGRRLRLKLLRRLDDDTDAVMTRQLFERLSGLWIKVGQLLSLRTDLISEAMSRELSGLQYQMRGFPTDVARRVVEEELQRPIGEVFAFFESTPFAAASIAQVHRATLLRNNRAVVVKVMRPDVERTLERDLRLLGGIAHFFKMFGLFKRFHLDEAMRELRSIFSEEVNYQNEAVNLRRMRKSLGSHDVYVPRVIKALTRRHVLVMEEVPGVLMSDYIRLRRTDPARVHRWSVLNGIDPEAVARRLSITVLRQILEDNEFHGDLHPGNIMLLADNRIALIDFGTVSRLRHHVWVLYQQSLASLAAHDYGRAADYMLMLSPSRSPITNRRVRLDLADVLQQWEIKAQMPASSYADRSIASMTKELAQVMADHRMPLNWGLMRVGRTFSTLDASLLTLTPDADFMKLTRAYYRDRLRRRRSRHGRIEALQSWKMQASAVLGDIQILIGGGLREQALRLHGMLDRGAYLRLSVLHFLTRGVWLLLILTSIAFILDEGYRDTQSSLLMIPAEYVRFIAASVPNFHFFHWVILLILGLYLTRLSRTARNALEMD